MIERAWISKNVMPRNAGVSNVRVTARCSNSTGADGMPGWPSACPSVRNASHLTQQNLECPFASVKHEFEETCIWHRGRTRPPLPWLTRAKDLAVGDEGYEWDGQLAFGMRWVWRWRHGAVYGGAAHPRGDRAGTRTLRTSACGVPGRLRPSRPGRTALFPRFGPAFTVYSPLPRSTPAPAVLFPPPRFAPAPALAVRPGEAAFAAGARRGVAGGARAADHHSGGGLHARVAARITASRVPGAADGTLGRLGPASFGTAASHHERAPVSPPPGPARSRARAAAGTALARPGSAGPARTRR